MKLFLGNRNYSSWSLRGWLAVRAAELHCGEVLIPLGTEEGTATLKAHSPHGKVPVLETDALVIHDSLAIGEYCAEQSPKLWPLDSAQRALARALAAEMHSGFQALRTELPMNIRRTPGAVPMSAACQRDIQRLVDIFTQCLAERSGPFLFGDWSLADIAFAPVVSRFASYAIATPKAVTAWRNAVLNHPHMLEWCALARQEEWVIPHEDI